jgi:hypothetical protein
LGDKCFSVSGNGCIFISFISFNPYPPYNNFSMGKYLTYIVTKGLPHDTEF